MSVTPISLLNRLRKAKPDAREWEQLQQIYLPLIRAWLTRVPGLDDEATDLSQDVFFVMIRELPRFERQREGSFRAWLRRVTINRVRNHLKAFNRRPRPASGDHEGDFLGRLEDPADELSKQWDIEHDRYVFQALISLVAVDFAPESLTAFRRLALQGHSAAQVAAELGTSENAVLLAKSRILKRLRTEASGLLD